jgi:hypothetical protein
MTDEESLDKDVLKSILVTIYGNFGTEHLSTYNPLCSNLIVEYSRMACNIAKDQLTSLGICKYVI